MLIIFSLRLTIPSSFTSLQALNLSKHTGMSTHTHTHSSLSYKSPEIKDLKVIYALDRLKIKPFLLSSEQVQICFPQVLRKSNCSILSRLMNAMWEFL